MGADSQATVNRTNKVRALVEQSGPEVMGDTDLYFSRRP
jgi:hypothetical protein